MCGVLFIFWGGLMKEGTIVGGHWDAVRGFEL